MPFEPLRTDEKLETPVKAEKDTDTVMLIGCSGFVGASLITYALVVWPYLVFPEIHQLAVLLQASGFALIPASTFGAIVVRRFGLASACGFVGGAMATAVFLFLRLTEVQVRRASREMDQPDYPAAFVWIVPSAWLVAAFLIAVLFIRKSEVQVGPNAKP
jgi:hypothetical protein